LRLSIPVELVFDQSIGDIFVGRVAGDVEDDIMFKSFEFATGVAGSKLIAVLGHTHCGAVKGTIDRVDVEEVGLDELNSLINVLEPAVATTVLRDFAYRTTTILRVALSPAAFTRQ
jgi:carbonic anhydrase